MSFKHCWIDCDPGSDDSIAILLASHSKNLKLIGISTVAGNQSIENTTKFALISMHLYGLIRAVSTEISLDDLKSTDCLAHGLDCPLVIGSSRPLLKKEHSYDYFDYGLDKFGIPGVPSNALKFTKELNSKYHFTKLIYDGIKNSPQPVTLIALGPLTNISILLINYPDVIKYIDKIVMMGGAIGLSHSIAEFNILVDPESASYVFDYGIPIYMIPLEVTHTALVTPEILEALSLSNLDKILAHLLLIYGPFYKTTYSMDHPPLHDPCAVAFLINPDLFEHKLMRVDVETNGKFSYGQTICDLHNISNKTKNIHVCTKMNVNKFWDMIFEAVLGANQITPVN